MSPENPPKKLTPRELDELASQVAACCREIRELRLTVSQFSDETVKRDSDKSVRSQFDRIAALENERDKLLPGILAVVAEIALPLISKSSDREAILLEADTKVRLSLHKFELQPQRSATVVDASMFRGWVRTIIKRVTIDHYRLSERGSTKKLNSRIAEEFGSGSKSLTLSPTGSEAIADISNDRRRGNVRSNAAVRQLPNCFTIEEEQHLAAIPEPCLIVFLFSTGLWNQLSAASQQQWFSAQTTPYEINSLNSLVRANLFVVRSVEDKLAETAVDWEVDFEAQFELLVQQKARAIAQQFNRHFWKFMQVDTVWQYLFAYVEPLSQDLLASVERVLDNELMLAYLQCDIYFGCDTATRCFDWLNRCGFENTLDRNLGRVAGQRAFVYDSKSGSELRTNAKKWEYACRLAGIEPQLADPDDFLASTFMDRDGPRGRALPLSVAAQRHCVDLPLAFERVSKFDLPK